jgi:negative regulator of sigma E activity
MLKQEQENIQNAKLYTCKSLPDETVGGVAANVYRVHSETPDVGKSDATIWISKSSGLPLKSDEDLNDGTSTQHHLIQWSYTDIHAPAIN